ncbi:hypothetical protein Tco_0929145 [Tanacetum coccineum]
MRRLRSGMIPRTVPGRPKINKTGQKAKSYARQRRAQLLESTPSLITIPSTDNILLTGLFFEPLGQSSINERDAEATGSMLQHRDGCVVGYCQEQARSISPPPPPCMHSSDVVKLKKEKKVLTRQVVAAGVAGVAGTDYEQGDDEDDGEDGEDEDDS